MPPIHTIVTFYFPDFCPVFIPRFNRFGSIAWYPSRSVSSSNSKDTLDIWSSPPTHGHILASFILFTLHMYMCVKYAHACFVRVHMCVHVGRAWDWCQESSDGLLLVHWGGVSLLSLKLLDAASLASQFALRIPCVCPSVFSGLPLDACMSSVLTTKLSPQACAP